MARIQRKAHDSSVVLYNHQKEAMCALNKADIGGEFSGIIVLPTGGGKTITASYWLTKSPCHCFSENSVWDMRALAELLTIWNGWELWRNLQEANPER